MLKDEGVLAGAFAELFKVAHAIMPQQRIDAMSMGWVDGVMPKERMPSMREGDPDLP